MAKPYLHAQSSARRFGGRPEDYIEIHDFLDSSKGAIPDNRHRCLTHQSWFLSNILERIKFSNSIETSSGRFDLIQNSDGKKISVREIGEQHVLEDFKGQFIPTPQDYLQEMDYQDWMQNGDGHPPSFAKIKERQNQKKAEKEKTADVVCDGKKPIVWPQPVTYDGSNKPAPTPKHLLD